MTTTTTKSECPCKDCISFAICNGNHTINCNILYHFLCDVNEHDMFYRYKSGHGIPVYNTYKKYIINTSHIAHKITLAKILHRPKGTLYDET